MQSLVAGRGLTSQGTWSYLPEGLAMSIGHTDLPQSIQGPEVLQSNLGPHTQGPERTTRT